MAIDMGRNGKSRKKEKHRRKVRQSFLASVVVQLTTLPIVLWFYGEVSVIGIFLNLLVLPTVGVVLGSGVCSSFDGTFQPEGILAGSYSGQSGAWGL